MILLLWYIIDIEKVNENDDSMINTLKCMSMCGNDNGNDNE